MHSFKQIAEDLLSLEATAFRFPKIWGRKKTAINVKWFSEKVLDLLFLYFFLHCLVQTISFTYSCITATVCLSDPTRDFRFEIFG